VIDDFKNLHKLFGLEELEGGLVKYFLNKNNLNTNNVFIKEVIGQDKSEKVFTHLMELDKPITLLDLEKVFELIIDPKDKQINGAVYTPDFIVDYIVDNIISKAGTVCDPACGSGAFLVGSLKRLNKLTKEPLIKLIEQNLFGIDLLEYSIRRTKIMLALYAILNGEDKSDIRFNLKVADSLETNWDAAFSNSKVGYKKFDYVVGNPPYVRIQDLGEKLKKRLSVKWKTTGDGNFNLYFPFFETGMHLISENGSLGYIVPNNYFTSLAGLKLRQYLHDKKKIRRIINFNHLKLFQNASTYTCITLISNSYNKDTFEYCYINKRKDLDNLGSIQFEEVNYDSLIDRKWRLLGEKDFDNIKKIEHIGNPIGKFFKIRVGIATLKDRIFFVKDSKDGYCKKTLYNKDYKIEKEITRRIVKISTVENEKDINENELRIIFPYKKVNGKYHIISENELKSTYPLCYKYLVDARKELNARDDGNGEYLLWYAYGRTQAFSYYGTRLYTRTFSDRPNFMLDAEKDSLFCNGYAVFIDKNVSVYQKILNSKLMDYYIKKTSVEIEGNYQCYQKNFIEKFTVPKLSDEEISYLESENDKNKIDRWLIKKYGLNLT
jgi:adenine-specific DNA-methyltransferase